MQFKGVPACLDKVCHPNKECPLPSTALAATTALFLYQTLFPHTCLRFLLVDSVHGGSNETSELGSIRSGAANLTMPYFELTDQRLEFLPGFLGPVAFSTLYLVYNSSNFQPVQKLDLKTFKHGRAFNCLLLGGVLEAMLFAVRRLAKVSGRRKSHPLLWLLRSLFWTVAMQYVSGLITTVLLEARKSVDQMSSASGYIKERKKEPIELVSAAPEYYRDVCVSTLEQTKSPNCAALIKDLSSRPMSLNQFLLQLQQPRRSAYVYVSGEPLFSDDCRVRGTQLSDVFVGLTGSFSNLSYPKPVLTPELQRVTEARRGFETGGQPLLKDARYRNCHPPSFVPAMPMSLEHLKALLIFLSWLIVSSLALLIVELVAEFCTGYFLPVIVKLLF